MRLTAEPDDQNRLGDLSTKRLSDHSYARPDLVPRMALAYGAAAHYDAFGRLILIRGKLPGDPDPA